MDIERGIIKSLFYDFPIDLYVRIVKGEEEQSLWKYLPQQLKWDLRAFDVQELEQAVNYYTERWADLYGEYKQTVWPLLIVAKTAGSFLTVENRRPRVKKEQLLRWRMISLLVGEDLLSLSWLAWKEKSKPFVRTNFVWEDTIPLTFFEGRLVTGNRGLSDLHSHIGASSDAFTIRWINWMNLQGRTNDNENKELVDLAIIIRFYAFEICLDSSFSVIEREKILDCFAIDCYRRELLLEISGRINSAKQNSIKPSFGQLVHWDYALADSLVIPEDDLTSPYMMLAGERFVMYEFLRRLYLKKPEAVEFAELFYLYQLIKTICRREYVQTNGLIGLSNYQNYENKNEGIDHLGEARKRYALQTALGNKGQNYLETRISWTWSKGKEKDPIPSIQVERSLFGNKSWIDRKQLLRKVRLVVSYSKKGFNHQDKANALHRLTDTYDEIIARMANNKKLEDTDFSVVGIDFTGSDEYTRPEIFAHLIRYARRHKTKSLRHFTYHVGEDFYDLLDGLRSIYEVLNYLKWDDHCRLGHALALATKPQLYYESRGWNVISRRQVLMDNLVWFLIMEKEAHFRIGKDFRHILVDQIKSLYSLIGYSEDFDLGTYIKSMKLRGDHPVGAGRENDLSLFVQTALDDDVALDELRKDLSVKALFDEYYSNKEIMKKGNDLIFWKMPKDVVNGIRHIQAYLLDVIKTRNIAIETCPSSNYMIGYFDKYIDLPLFIFLEKIPDNPISINTDDRGIIATSIENEYALIYAAMEKNRRYRGKTSSIMENIRISAKKNRFKVV